MSDRPSYEHTFNVGDYTLSSDSYSIYYSSGYKDMECGFTYTFTQGKVAEETYSRKGIKSKEERNNE